MAKKAKKSGRARKRGRGGASKPQNVEVDWGAAHPAQEAVKKKNTFEYKRLETIWIQFMESTLGRSSSGNASTAYLEQLVDDFIAAGHVLTSTVWEAVQRSLSLRERVSFMYEAIRMSGQGLQSEFVAELEASNARHRHRISRVAQCCANLRRAFIEKMRAAKQQRPSTEREESATPAANRGFQWDVLEEEGTEEDDSLPLAELDKLAQKYPPCDDAESVEESEELQRMNALLAFLAEATEITEPIYAAWESFRIAMMEDGADDSEPWKGIEVPTALSLAAIGLFESAFARLSLCHPSVHSLEDVLMLFYRIVSGDNDVRENYHGDTRDVVREVTEYLFQAWFEPALRIISESQGDRAEDLTRIWRLWEIIDVTCCLIDLQACVPPDDRSVMDVNLKVLRLAGDLVDWDEHTLAMQDMMEFRGVLRRELSNLVNCSTYFAKEEAARVFMAPYQETMREYVCSSRKRIRPTPAMVIMVYSMACSTLLLQGYIGDIARHTKAMLQQSASSLREKTTSAKSSKASVVPKWVLRPAGRYNLLPSERIEYSTQEQYRAAKFTGIMDFLCDDKQLHIPGHHNQYLASRGGGEVAKVQPYRYFPFVAGILSINSKAWLATMATDSIHGSVRLKSLLHLYCALRDTNALGTFRSEVLEAIIPFAGVYAFNRASGQPLELGSRFKDWLLAIHCHATSVKDVMTVHKVVARIAWGQRAHLLPKSFSQVDLKARNGQRQNRTIDAHARVPLQFKAFSTLFAIGNEGISAAFRREEDSLASAERILKNVANRVQQEVELEVPPLAINWVKVEVRCSELFPELTTDLGLDVSYVREQLVKLWSDPSQAKMAHEVSLLPAVLACVDARGDDQTPPEEGSLLRLVATLLKLYLSGWAREEGGYLFV